MGRPRIHDGDTPIIVRINKRLLDIIDADAKAEGVSRNTVITRELAKSALTNPHIADIKKEENHASLQ